MKRIFIETKYQGELDISEEIISKLPSKLILAMPVQFLGFQKQIQTALEKSGRKIELFQSQHAKYPAQILGCDILKSNSTADAFFYIGDGRFHPTALLYQNKILVYCYNPFTQQMNILEYTLLEKLEKKRKGLLIKFLEAKEVGVLATIKPGQSSFTNLEQLRSKLEQQGKNVYIMLADEINFNQLENFNFIQVWINTACPRIVEDFASLNSRDLEELY